jgi:hypothetical protein
MVSTLAGISAGGLVYVILIFATGAITRDELTMLPKGGKLVKIYDKFLPRKRHIH